MTLLGEDHCLWDVAESNHASVPVQEKSHKAAQQLQQLESTQAQLHDRTAELQQVQSQLRARTEELQEVQAQFRCFKCRTSEESRIAQIRICALESKIANSEKQIDLAHCTASHRMSHAPMGSACTSLPDDTFAQQMRAACARADHAQNELRSREHDIEVMQNCLEAERKDKEGVQETLSSVLKLHNQLHVHLAEVCFPKQVTSYRDAGD